MYKPRVFIGSSANGTDIAEAVARAIADSCQTEPWFDGGFRLSRGNLDNLERIAREVEFAILVLTPDDFRDRGRGARPAPRDNVLFELGLFTGALGTSRTFALRPSGVDLDLPTDLLGVQLAEFQPTGLRNQRGLHYRRALDTAVAVASRTILAAIKAGKSTVVPRVSRDVTTVYPQRRLLNAPQWNAFIRNARRHLWLFGISEFPYAEDRETARTLSRHTPSSCDVRILLLDPRSPHVLAITRDESYSARTLKGRIEDALALFSEMRYGTRRRPQIKTYRSYPQVSMVRADHRALITHYIRPLPGNDCPTLEVRELPKGGGVFERYLEHFHRVWGSAKEWRPHATSQAPRTTHRPR